MTLIGTTPPELKQLIKNAKAIDQENEAITAKSITLIDHTSLSDTPDTPMMGIETPEQIKALCKAAVGEGDNHVAAVCVYPNFIELARECLDGSGVKVAVVHNFPHGDQDIADAVEDVKASIDNGAEEIDTVVDYAKFIGGGDALPILAAVSEVCKLSDVSLKIILKASVYTNYDHLYYIAQLACEAGADFVKTCTGKLPKEGFGGGSADVSTLETGAVVIKAVADYNRDFGTSIGVKISGGVKTQIDCARFHYLVEQLLGEAFYHPDTFRYGASSLLSNLLNTSLTNSENY